MKNIYVEMGRPNDYVDFVKKSGKVISISEADSLTYAAAELKYTNNDCAGAIGFVSIIIFQNIRRALILLETNFYMS